MTTQQAVQQVLTENDTMGTDTSPAIAFPQAPLTAVPDYDLIELGLSQTELDDLVYDNVWTW